MSDNIVDLAARRAAKQLSDDVTIVDPIVVITDRLGYRLVDKIYLETIIEEKVVDRRLASKAEIDMVFASQYHLAMLCKIAGEHAPHLQYDDYLTYPYIDWEHHAKNNLGLAPLAELDDTDPVKFQRLIHVLLTEARKYSNDKIGILPPGVTEAGATIASDQSPFKFYIEGPKALADNSIQVSFDVVNPVSSKTDEVSIEIVDFGSVVERGQFLAALLGFTTLDALTLFLYDYINTARRGAMVIREKPHES
jgi:hypothetical protein